MEMDEAAIQACIDFLERQSKAWASLGVPDGATAMSVAAMRLKENREEILDEAAKLRLRKPKW